MFLRRMLNRIRPMTLREAAASAREVSPAEERLAKPSLSLPGELDAIIEVVNGNRALEWSRVTGAARLHHATTAYTLENARIKDEYVASGRYLKRFPTRMPLEKPAAADRQTYLPQAVLSTNMLSGLEFGHWVRDSLVTELHGTNEGLPTVALARELWPHEPAFRELSGLSCDYVADCRFGKLVILDDRGHNAYWRSRFLQLRQRLQQAAGQYSGESAGPLVMLSRGGQARVREPSNQAEIGAALEAIGFRTVVPSELSVPDISVALRDAKIVVSTEGSHLNHLHFFAPAGLTVITMQDPRRFYAYHKDLIDIYDGQFGFVAGRPDPNLPDRYRVNGEVLKRTLDLIG